MQPFNTVYAYRARDKGSTATILWQSPTDTNYDEVSVWGSWFYRLGRNRAPAWGGSPLTSQWAYRAKSRGQSTLWIRQAPDFTDRDSAEASVWLPWFLFQSVSDGSLTKALGTLTGSSAAVAATLADVTVTLGDLTSSSASTALTNASLSVTLGALTSSSSGLGYTFGEVTVTLGTLECIALTRKGDTPITTTRSLSTQITA